MHAVALITVVPAAPAGRGALRALILAARTLRSRPGFRRWQTFRAMGAPDALHVVVDWDSKDGLRRALEDPGLAGLREQARQWGFEVSPPEFLSPAFDRRLTHQPGVATLLRMSRPADPARDSEARDSEHALQALAAPGSIRLFGARSRTTRKALCRIDFDTEDGLWYFLQSPQRRAWSSWAREGLEEESWALNLPRLDFHPPGAPSQPQPRPPRPEGSLSVQFLVSDDRASASIWLQGRMEREGRGARGFEWCGKLCEILLADGCRSLEVDVSGLSEVSPQVLTLLTRTARQLKELGGQFVLIDNEARVKQVTRARHLETSLL